MEKIILNVGGTIFETTRETLQRYPDTRLARLSKDTEEYDFERLQYFFDRNPDTFNSILDYYRFGQLHFPTTACGATLRMELAYWEIPEDEISDCCLQTFYKYDNDKEIMKTLKKTFSESNVLNYSDIECQKNPFIRMKQKVWKFLDQPRSSRAAQVFNIIYILVVVFSISIFFFNTHPSFRVAFDMSSFADNDTLAETFTRVNWDNPKERLYYTTMVHPFLSTSDLIVSCFFTLEVIVHFATCPKLLRFFCSGLNVLDVSLSIIVWIVYSLERVPSTLVSNPRLTMFYIVMKCLLILRMFRIFRLVRQYKPLKLLILALRASLNQLVLLAATFMIASVLFASFIYYAEYEEPTTFPNAIVGIWWAIVTITTVGYGDIVPKLLPGRIVGALCSMLGILLLAMPVAVIATNFSDLHSRNSERERSEKSKLMRKSAEVIKCSSKVQVVPQDIKVERVD